MTPSTPPSSADTTVTADQLATTLEALRGATPLVQCITNTVVQNWTANVLLAAGAAPAMVDNPHEAGDFARVASGLLVNLGTPQDDTVAAMRVAVAAADDAGTPWVLDPVAAGGLAWRTDLAHELVALGPTVVRGNPSEVLALAGGTGGRGVDSTDAPEAAVDAARGLTDRVRVVAVSGEVDHVLDATRLVRLSNGHPWLTKVTGVGCALGALMAAYAACTDDPLLAASAATAHLTVAADEAAAQAQGPGSFAVHLLDALELLTPDQLASRVRVS
jgi:hydroxyethylthiazole kinase